MNTAHALFEKYPRLRETLPLTPLATLPTPIERLETLEAALGAAAPRLYVKRDDLSGELYGGNKARKLEFIFGRAMQMGCTETLTFGGAGSNHALATALYAKALGLKSISMLVPQPPAHCVRQNLLADCRAQSELHLHSSIAATAAAALLLLLRRKWRTGRFPCLIPPGGSSAWGMIGFVNAGFELRRQVEEGIVPLPARIYIASGTMGSSVGLMLGLRAAGLDSVRLIAVRVTQRQFNSIRIARTLFQKVNTLLTKHDPSFPPYAFPEERFDIEHGFYGQGYGMYTPEGVRAVTLAREAAGMELEGTYTGKTFAALLAHAHAGKLAGKTALFWNTYSSAEVESNEAALDFHLLPKAFHRYFEEEVQPLDRQ